MTDETPKPFIAIVQSSVNEQGQQIDILEPTAGYTEDDRPDDMPRFMQNQQFKTSMRRQ